MKRYSKSHHEMVLTLYEMEKMLGRLPELYEICEYTGKIATAVIKVLQNIDFYPSDKLITPKEKAVLDVYRPGLKVCDVARMTGELNDSTSRIMINLSKKGLIDYKPRKRTPVAGREVPDQEKPGVYIRVTDGAYKDAMGYIKKFSDVVICNLWINRKLIKDIRLQSEDIREVKDWRRLYEKA